MVFEASLLDIPMLFYAFDLFDYISKRDFYYDFESFVPGKIVFSQRELTEAIVAGDFESEKVPPFKIQVLRPPGRPLQPPSGRPDPALHR